MGVQTFNPRVVYNTSTTLNFTLPMRIWDPLSKGIGGQNVSTAGIPEAFELRRDETVKITLRFFESEWTNIHTWLLFQQRNPGVAMTFYFQQNPLTPGSGFSVYLDKPAMNDDIAPKRGDMKGTFELDIVLRSTNSTSLHVQAY